MSDEQGHPRSAFVVRSAFLVAALALFLSLAASAVLALDVPPPPTQWYTDAAGLLDSSQAAALNEKLRAFEQQNGAQVIIYVFPSLDSEALEDFTIRCAEKWKVGNKKYDNGLILFVFVKERKLRVEVGYGLEGTITDAFSSDVIRNYIAPHFKQNDYAGGLNAAADAIIAKISGGEAPVPPTSPGATGRPAGAFSGSGGGLPCSAPLILIVIIFLLVVVPAMLMPNRRRQGCGGCILPFFLWPSGGSTFGGGGFGGFSGGGGGFGGFSGGGGGFGGGGASGGW
jgi:uncharacterized protein